MALPTSPPESLRGARHPRVEVAPPHVESFGPEAIELASRAGLELDFWQQQALVLMLATREDGRWACFEYGELVARQQGKGALLEARALAGLFLLGEQLIMWSAHEYKTAMEGFRRFRGLLKHLGEMVNDTLIDIGGVPVKFLNTNGEESFERLDTGQRVKFIARSKGSGRGFSGDVNFIDEAFAYTSDQQEALMPTVLARPNPQIIYTTSPPLDGESGEPLFALKARAEAGGDDSLGWRDWGVKGNLDNLDAIDLDDRNLWAATNPALGTRVTEEMIERSRRSMTAVGFAREILGVWPRQADSNGGVIDPAAWASLNDPDSQPGENVAFAAEVSLNREWTSITVWSVREDGVGHAEVIDRRSGTDWVVDRLVELRERWNPVGIGLDGKGPTLSLVSDLEAAGITRGEPDAPKRGELVVFSLQDMVAAYGQFLDAVTQQTFRHRGQPEFDTAVHGARARTVGDVEVLGRKNVDVDIGPLTGAIVARRVFATRIDQIRKPKRTPGFAFV